MKTFLVFGNPLVPQDSLALKLIPKLKKQFPGFNFRETDSTENLQDFGPELNIIDVAPEIKKIKLIEIKNENDLKKLKIESITSMHDFDLGYNLKLLMQVKKIKTAKIILIPFDMVEDKAFEEIKKQINNKKP